MEEEDISEISDDVETYDESEIAETADNEELGSSEIDDLDEINGIPTFGVPALDRINLSAIKELTIKTVKDEDRITSHILSHTELTEAIGLRASQIENNPTVFTDVTGYSDAILMAVKELGDRRSPLAIEREIRREGNVIWVERWNLNDMVIPSHYIKTYLSNGEIEKVRASELLLAQPAKEPSAEKKVKPKDKPKKKKQGKGK